MTKSSITGKDYFERTVNIAGETIHLRCHFRLTADQFSDYLALHEPGETADLKNIISLEATREEMIAARKSYYDAQNQDGIPIVKRRNSEYESVVLMHKIADTLAERGILLMHGSVVVVDGLAYLFTASSGTGKSTHTQLWLSKFGTNAYILNDDRPFLKVEDSSITVFSSPWMGKHRRGIKGTARLTGIAEIIRSQENRIVPVEKVDAFCMLRKHSYYPKDSELAQQIMLMHRKIVENVKAYRLYCNREPEAADVAYEGMRQR